MNIVLPGYPDRAINELFAWIACDPKTGLEGICGMSTGEGVSMQAVSSSRAVMERMGVVLKSAIEYRKLELKLVRFVREDFEILLNRMVSASEKRIAELEEELHMRARETDRLERDIAEMRGGTKLFDIGEYRFSEKNERFWLEHKTGEGMEIQPEMIDRFYKQNF